MQTARRTYPLIYGGIKREASKTNPIFNKYSREEIGRVGLATRDEINDCFEQANDSIHKMANSHPHERAEILKQLLNLMSSNSKELAEIITAEVGKPIVGSEVEVARALATVSDGIKEAESATPDGVWREFTSSAGRYSMLSRRFPIGVASFVTPFNFPLNLVVSKILYAS